MQPEHILTLKPQKGFDEFSLFSFFSISQSFISTPVVGLCDGTRGEGQTLTSIIKTD